MIRNRTKSRADPKRIPNSEGYSKTNFRMKQRRRNAINFQEKRSTDLKELEVRDVHLKVMNGKAVVENRRCSCFPVELTELLYWLTWCEELTLSNLDRR